MSTPRPVPGFRQVWMMDRGGKAMVPVGIITGDTGEWTRAGGRRDQGSRSSTSPRNRSTAITTSLRRQHRARYLERLMRDTFTKRSPTAPRSYPAEAAGLAWLRCGRARSRRRRRGASRSPKHHITVRRLDPVRPTGAAMEAFGWALAATHAAGADDVRPAAGRAGTRTASSAPSRSACDRSRPGATSTPSSDCCRTPSRPTGSAP